MAKYPTRKNGTRHESVARRKARAAKYTERVLDVEALERELVTVR